MKRLAVALALAALSCNSAAGWVIISDNEEYIAYADPATITREGNLVQMSDLVDLKSPRSSPYGNPHASSTAHSQFDCDDPRIKTIAFFLHSGQMGNGDLVETAAVSNGWLPVAPGTLLDILRQFACSQT
jgi:surface-adhesin protein E